MLAAVTIGKYFKVPEKKIKEAIENYIPSNSRSQLVEKASNKIILDAYNANPSSMKLAVENFARMNGDDKVLVLGSMAELGTQSRSEHELLIDQIKKYKWTDVILVGKEFGSIKHSFRQFDSAEEVKKWLQDQNFKNALVLVKGSRSMQMEKVVEGGGF